MPLVSRQRAYERYKTDATNSSHFVWLLGSMNYFECSNGWLFGFEQKGHVTYLALEPLVPTREITPEAFDLAWKELDQMMGAETYVFVSVYSGFVEILKSRGFQCVQVGQEPWMDLYDCIPKGNVGKGVRSARNQAIHAGITVEEWSGQDVASDLSKKEILSEILEDWRSRHLVEIRGFLNAVDPFAFSESRRYFISRSADGKPQAFLIATPVSGKRGYFLEDLVIRRRAPRGVAELLTLEAMVALQESGAETASLGVVSMTSVHAESTGLPQPIRFLLVTAPRMLRKVYNFDGLETFRKRFKPKKWESIHLAVKSKKPSARSWLKALLGLASVFKPRPRLSPKALASLAASPLQRHPITAFVASVSLVLFATINRFGDLPDWALHRFGFTGNADWSEWLHRSVISDFLYFNPTHFWVWGTALFALIYFAEKSHKRAFLAPFLIATCVFDDFVNYAFIVKPFHYFQPHLFEHLISVKDVGGSLILSALAGLQLCQFRRNREVIFALLGLSLVFGFAFSSAHLSALILNLNHFFFLSVGYLVGKLRFEYHRKLNQMASKGKPPVAKSVLNRRAPTPGRREDDLKKAA